MNIANRPLTVGGQRGTILFLIALLSCFLGGCASTETVKNAQGQGVTRAYASAYDAVFNATITAAKEKKLDVVESDRQNGRLILSHGITWLSWGERIAVFIKAISSNSTEVEIVSKPVLSPLNFPPNWQQILLDQIDADLRDSK